MMHKTIQLISFHKRTVIAVMLMCFFAEIIHKNLYMLFGFCIYELIGFKEYKPSSFGLLGCVPELWMAPVWYFSSTIYFMALIATGFVVTKNAKTTFQYCLGALLFYPVISGIVQEFSLAFLMHRIPYSYAIDSEKWKQMMLPFFGNYYNYKIVSISIGYLMLAVEIYLAYRIVFYYWQSAFRNIIFTFGVMSCGAGWLVWYFWLGPLIYKL